MRIYRYTQGKTCYICGGPVPNNAQLNSCQGCRAAKHGRPEEECERIRQAIKADAEKQAVEAPGYYARIGA